MTYQPGDFVVNEHSGTVMAVAEVESGAVYLRPIGGGRAIVVKPGEIRAAGRREALSARVAAANRRTGT